MSGISNANVNKSGGSTAGLNKEQEYTYAQLSRTDFLDGDSWVNLLEMVIEKAEGIYHDAVQEEKVAKRWCCIFIAVSRVQNVLLCKDLLQELLSPHHEVVIDEKQQETSGVVNVGQDKGIDRLQSMRSMLAFLEKKNKTYGTITRAEKDKHLLANVVFHVLFFGAARILEEENTIYDGLPGLIFQYLESVKSLLCLHMAGENEAASQAMFDELVVHIGCYLGQSIPVERFDKCVERKTAQWEGILKAKTDRLERDDERVPLRCAKKELILTKNGKHIPRALTYAYDIKDVPVDVQSVIYAQMQRVEERLNARRWSENEIPTEDELKTKPKPKVRISYGYKYRLTGGEWSVSGGRLYAHLTKVTSPLRGVDLCGLMDEFEAFNKRRGDVCKWLDNCLAQVERIIAQANLIEKGSNSSKEEDMDTEKELKETLENFKGTPEAWAEELAKILYKPSIFDRQTGENSIRQVIVAEILVAFSIRKQCKDNGVLASSLKEALEKHLEFSKVKVREKHWFLVQAHSADEGVGVSIQGLISKSNLEEDLFGQVLPTVQVGEMNQCMVEMYPDDLCLELVRKTPGVSAFKDLGPIGQEKAKEILARPGGGVEEKHPKFSILSRKSPSYKPREQHGCVIM